MPEYLAPGVFIEETSFRGKPIEGVSTSTAGFVGRAARGPEGTPILVTSFMQFVREFGDPISSPSGPGDFLGHAIRGFFDNGGLRAYVVRVLGSGAAAATSSYAGSTAAHGVVLRLAKNTTVLAGATVVKLDSLRGVSKIATAELKLFTRTSSSSAFALAHTSKVTGYDPLAGTVTLTTPFPAGNPVQSTNAYVLLTGTTPEPAASVTATKVPVFTAKDRGAGGNTISVRVSPTDRPPVRITTSIAANATTVTVATVAGFYVGALVEIDSGTTAKQFATVTDVDAETNVITVGGPLAAVVVPNPPVGPQYIRVLELAIEVLNDGVVVESFVGLSGNPDTTAASFSRYYAARINDPDTGSAWVSVTAGAGTANVPTDWPIASDGQPILLQNGTDGAAPQDTDLIGADNGPGARTGIQALTDVEGISIVAVPGVTSEAVQGQLITHCELMKYRVAVLDAPKDKTATGDVSAHRNQYDSTRAAYYAPWLETLDLTTGGTIVVPPSGHVMGIYARSDNERGVHKAPANEVVRGITGLVVPYTTGEQEVLNPIGVNLVREFDGRGIRVWGARTASSDQEWKYLNVRRLFIYCEASIDRGTKWVVFEPNNESLWARVVSTIESFLLGVWKTGALMGTTPEQAYFVRCDRTTMTQDDIDNGRLVCLVGLAPTKPAEFVIFRIGQFVPTQA